MQELNSAYIPSFNRASVQEDVRAKIGKIHILAPDVPPPLLRGPGMSVPVPYYVLAHIYAYEGEPKSGVRPGQNYFHFTIVRNLVKFHKIIFHAEIRKPKIPIFLS